MPSFEIAEHILALAALYSVIALGFALSYAVQRFFDISQGAAFLVGAYVGYQAASVWGWPIPICIIVAAGAAAAFGALVEISVVGVLRRRQAPPLVLFIATLGVLILTQSVIAGIYGSDVKVYPPPGPIGGIAPKGYPVSASDQVLFLVAVPLALATSWAMSHTRLGRRLRAVSDREALARIIGAPVRSMLFASSVLGAAFSGVGGFLFGLDRGVSPGSGLPAVLAAIIASVVGGAGSIPGAMVGGVVLSVLETLGVVFLPGGWKYTIVFGALIVFLSVRPQGLYGRTARRA